MASQEWHSAGPQLVYQTGLQHIPSACDCEHMKLIPMSSLNWACHQPVALAQQTLQLCECAAVTILAQR